MSKSVDILYIQQRVVVDTLLALNQFIYQSLYTLLLQKNPIHYEYRQAGDESKAIIHGMLRQVKQ